TSPEQSPQFESEAQLQPKLHISGVQCARCLAKVQIINFVMSSTALRCKQEVRAVENVERLPLEFQFHLFGDSEVLRECHVGQPLPRAHERVPSKVPSETCGWRREDRQAGLVQSGAGGVNHGSSAVAPTISPRRLRLSAEPGYVTVRPVIAPVVAVVVATKGRTQSVEWLPVCSALE